MRAERTAEEQAKNPDITEEDINSMFLFMENGEEKTKTADAWRNEWNQFCLRHKMAERIKPPKPEKGKPKKSPRGNNIKPYVTLYQFRHAYATLLFEADIPELDAMEYLGHSSITTTKNVYTHIRQKRKTDTAAKLNAHVNKTEENEEG